jgi:Tfp pilus assembly protein PilF
MILEQQGKRDLAKKRYESALAIDPRAATAANNLAWLLAEEGSDLDRALQLAQTATAAAPNNHQVLDTLGWVYFKKQQPQLAVPLFARSIELNPLESWYHYHLGLAYLKAGDALRGRAALQRALDIGMEGNTSTEIKRLLAESNSAQ